MAKLVKFCQQCEILPKFEILVKIVICGQKCEMLENTVKQLFVGDKKTFLQC